jgi:hypothetical protein
MFKKCTFLEKMWIMFLEYFYTKLLKLNFNEYFESLFYLFGTFKSKNRNIINEQEHDLNAFLKNESDTMINTVKETAQFYENLKRKDLDKLKMFKDKLQEID